MEADYRRYPIGIQNFEQLRNRNCVYVDKTELVYQLANTDSVYFLSRPRRFGKRTHSFFASIPYDLDNKTEKHYQTIFYLLFRLMGFYVECEVKSAIGRADVVIRMPNTVYILEFKYDGTAAEALEQIERKGYASPYRKEGKQIVTIGIRFDSATRSIGEWKIRKESGGNH